MAKVALLRNNWLIEYQRVWTKEVGAKWVAEYVSEGIDLLAAKGFTASAKNLLGDVAVGVSLLIFFTSVSDAGLEEIKAGLMKVSWANLGLIALLRGRFSFFSSNLITFSKGLARERTSNLVGSAITIFSAFGWATFLIESTAFVSCFLLSLSESSEDLDSVISFFISIGLCSTVKEGLTTLLTVSGSPTDIFGAAGEGFFFSPSYF